MAIHHAIVKKAEKLGLIGTEPVCTADNDVQPGTVQFHWPKHNVYAYGIGARPAMEQAEALIALKDLYPTCHIQNDEKDPFQIRVWNDDRSLVLSRDAMLPVEALALASEAKEWAHTKAPEDGAQAFKEGFTAADNPFSYDEDEEAEGQSEEHQKAEAWDQAFDDAADADGEDAEPETGGSVVRPEYRIRYAEAGHPNHCGDWLAVTLNNLVLGKSSTDMENLEALFLLNGVDTSKYKHHGNGWQGRIRMTGRNMLAPRLYRSGGVLMLTPALQVDGVDRLRASPEWMAAAALKYKAVKPKVAEPTPVVEADDEEADDEEADDEEADDEDEEEEANASD